MEWTENEEIINDRCSTASSLSNSGETNPLVNSNSNGSSTQVKNQTIQSNQMNCSASVNLDSYSDGELSDFSLNDSDDDELRSSGDRNSGKNLFFFIFHLNFSIRTR